LPLTLILSSEGRGKGEGDFRFMKIVVNGKEQEAQEGITIKELLEKLELNPSQVAVELNKEIVKRAKYSETCLRDGDKLEIVRLVGGG